MKEYQETSDILKRAANVRVEGCYNTECADCILNNVICHVDFLGDEPAEDSKMLMTGFFTGMKFREEML